jgi:hypothetical protein
MNKNVLHIAKEWHVNSKWLGLVGTKELKCIFRVLKLKRYLTYFKAQTEIFLNILSI